jgi:AcrR family transcriptional regulator
VEGRQNRRAEETRARIRAAAQRLFLRQGYLATSTDAILAEAGISSKETLYRHYAGKEQLFVDVLRHLTLEEPGFSEQVAALPAPQDLAALHAALTTLAREILAMMRQPEYLALLGIVITEAPRFPQLGPLFFSAVPQRGLALVLALLRAAREQRIIADVDLDAMAHALLGALLTYAIQGFMGIGQEEPPPAQDPADAVVAVVMRALAPR